MGRNFEKLIEHIINGDEAAARKLFHNVVVSKSRSIYENLEMEGMMHGEEDEEMEEGVGDIVDSVELDQTSDMMEADDEDMAPEMGDDDMGDGVAETRAKKASLCALPTHLASLSIE